MGESGETQQRTGKVLEQILADEYGIEVDRTDYRDAISSSGLEYQIKGTLRRMSYDPSRRGRFRIYDKELSNVDRYIFAIYTDQRSPEILTHKTMKPDEVREVVNDEGISWSSLGATGTESGKQQAKISWAAIFPDLAEDEDELFN